MSGMEDGGQASGALSGDSLGDFLDNDLGEDGDGPSSSPQGMDLSPAQMAALTSRPGQSMGGPRLHRQQDAIQPGSTPFGETCLRCMGARLAQAVCLMRSLGAGTMEPARSQGVVVSAGTHARAWCIFEAAE